MLARLGGDEFAVLLPGTTRPATRAAASHLRRSAPPGLTIFIGVASCEHTGAVLEAVGLPLSTRSRVRSIATATGRDIDLLDVSPDHSRASWRDRGWPDGAIEVTLSALEEYGTHPDRYTAWTLDQRPSVQEIIGRPLRSYDDWVSEHATLYR